MRHYVARPPTPALAKLVEYVWASQGACTTASYNDHDDLIFAVQ